MVGLAILLGSAIVDHRVGRLIALGRAALAIVALTAAWIDPAHADGGLRLLLLGYAVYPLLIANYQWFQPTQPTGWPLLAHLLDLLVFTWLLYQTDGPASPF